jgi:hypothetical protein
MGLKTTNYQVAETGVVLPTAVAIAQIDTKNNVAIFNIAINREYALAGKTVKQVRIPCEFDRNENPFITAYRTATQPRLVKRVNEMTGLEEEVNEIPYFNKWQDDRV